eukprot:GHVT01005581.1.p1 GENE.GHVT01005581.1~~GHVT01005581.1.p1  ORF type:complete len:342 (+),score=39.33 GHVT01005581.1:1008-2033(+)
MRLIAACSTPRHSSRKRARRICPVTSILLFILQQIDHNGRLASPDAPSSMPLRCNDFARRKRKPTTACCFSSCGNHHTPRVCAPLHQLIQPHTITKEGRTRRREDSGDNSYSLSDAQVGKGFIFLWQGLPKRLAPGFRRVRISTSCLLSVLSFSNSSRSSSVSLGFASSATLYQVASWRPSGFSRELGNLPASLLEFRREKSAPRSCVASSPVSSPWTFFSGISSSLPGKRIQVNNKNAAVCPQVPLSNNIPNPVYCGHHVRRPVDPTTDLFFWGALKTFPIHPIKLELRRKFKVDGFPLSFQPAVQGRCQTFEDYVALEAERTKNYCRKMKQWSTFIALF